MIPIIAIRPEPGLSATIARGREAGLRIEGVPLFEIRPLDWEPPPAGDFEALLIGSANAIRHGGPALDGYRRLPVHAVGENTARAASEAGLAIGSVGEGGLQALLDGQGRGRRYLRLAGQAHVPLVIPAGSTVTTRIVYQSARLPMPEALAEKLRDRALVLLHSAEAARHLADECARLGLGRERIALAGLGPRIAEAAGGGWVDLRSAERPTESALLALTRDMCH